MATDFESLRELLNGTLMSPETAGRVTPQEVKAAMCTIELLNEWPELWGNEDIQRKMYEAILQNDIRVQATGTQLQIGGEKFPISKDYGPSVLNVNNFSIIIRSPNSASNRTGHYRYDSGGSSNNNNNNNNNNNS